MTYPLFNHRTTNAYVREFHRVYGNMKISWFIIIAGFLRTALSSLYIQNGRIYKDDGTRHRVFGMNWYGMETEIRVMEGLWAHDIRFYFDLLSRKQFNTIRMPFALEGLRPGQYDQPINIDYLNQCTSCRPNSTTYDILDLFFEMGDEYGIDIVMDLHRLHFHATSQLWYDNTFPQQELIDGWAFIINRFGNHSSFAYIDLYNEPHGKASINTGNSTTDWDQFVIEWLDNHQPGDKLLWVNGIAWGQDMRNMTRLQQMPAEKKSRLVISPHCYGPTLTFLPNNTKSYLWKHLDSYFGYLSGDFPIVVGEWGGNQDSFKDVIWMDMFVEYLIDRDFDSCFWALNPNSKDVRGYLLPDWSTIDPYKGVLLDSILAVRQGADYIHA